VQDATAALQEERTRRSAILVVALIDVVAPGLSVRCQGLSLVGVIDATMLFG
jgi:hypothetical protein